MQFQFYTGLIRLINVACTGTLYFTVKDVSGTRDPREYYFHTTATSVMDCIQKCFVKSEFCYSVGYSPGNPAGLVFLNFLFSIVQYEYRTVSVRNFRIEFEGDLELGKEIKVGEVFKEGDYVDAIGVSKGKGFQGVVRRHGFHGVGQSTHGQHNRERAPGSIGGASSPSRVFKGMRMAGQMGGKRVKTLNLRVVKIYPDDDLVLLSGAVPGPKNSTVILEK